MPNAAGRTGMRRRNEVFSWNPRRPIRPGLAGRLLPVRKRVNNFGDLLGPVIVDWMLRQRGLSAHNARGRWQLLSVGSVMHFSRDGAVVWGTGVNGKIDLNELKFSDLDVRAVRGPLTAGVLRGREIAVPQVFGDPGLLVSQAFPHLRRRPDTPASHRITVVRSLNDRSAPPTLGDSDVMLDPRGPLEHVLSVIARSEFVVSSSLHGLVVADAFGVPSRMLVPEHEHQFKYDDYYQGTNRIDVSPARSLAEAVEMGGVPPLAWDPAPLMAAFPYDLWH